MTFKDNNRGFASGDRHLCSYRSRYRVQQSSSVEPHVWLFVDTPCDVNDAMRLGDEYVLYNPGHVYLTPAAARELAVELLEMASLAEKRRAS